LTYTSKHSDISGTSELLIIQFEQYGTTAQSIALFPHTYTHALTYAQTYTHYTPAVAVSGTF